MGKLMIITLVCVLVLGAVTMVDFGAVDGNKYMIPGLEGYEMITHEQASGLPEATGMVELTLDGRRLPYDRATNTYFIPQSRENDYFDGRIEVSKREGYEYYVCAYDDVDKAQALDGSIGYRIYGVKGEECISSKFIFTPLDVICVYTDDGALPGDAYSTGELQVFSVEYGELTFAGSGLEIKVRGNTSRRFPKKSYRVKLVDGNGGSFHMTIAGLRMDDDWILNAMYTDASKIREKLAYELWDEMNSSGSAANSSRIEHVELFINGSYWGLYGIQERVDNKQVDGDKRADVLYKVATNERPTVEQLTECNDRVSCGGFEVQGESYGGTTAQLWQPAAAYMAVLNGEPIESDSRIAMENAIDYGLWVMATQAHDCHFKNQFINCVYGNGGYTMYKLPWDVNHTFGDVWLNDGESTNFSGFRIGSLVLDGLFGVMVDSGDENISFAIQARWLKLRSGTLAEENIIARAEAMFADIAPAVERDTHRWPECGMGGGNNTDVSDIVHYITETLPRADEYISEIGN